MLDPALDKVVVADISTAADVVRIEEAVTAAGFDPSSSSSGYPRRAVATKNPRCPFRRVQATDTEDGVTGKLSADMGKAAVPGRINGNPRFRTRRNELGETRSGERP